MENLTLIIPAKNESKSLPGVLENLKKFNCKILVSLKDSDIETIDAIKNYNIEVFKQSKNGYGNSLIEGINNCKTEFFCIFNADGSFEQNDLPFMLKLCENNDFIYGTRYEGNGGSEDDTLITYIGNKIFSLIGKIFFGLKTSDILYTYILGKTISFKKLNIINNDFRFCVELPIKMQKNQMKYKNFPSFEKKRIAGTKKVSEFKDGFLILLEMIKLYFK